MRVERFEDLVAWQKALKLVTRIYQITAKGPIARDFALRNQLQSAAISIPANIAEGFERSYLREFHQYLATAKASCAEVRTYLYVAAEVGYLTPEQTRAALNAAEEVGKIVGGLRASIAAKLQLSTQHSALSTSRRKKCS